MDPQMGFRHPLNSRQQQKFQIIGGRGLRAPKTGATGLQMARRSHGSPWGTDHLPRSQFYTGGETDGT